MSSSEGYLSGVPNVDSVVGTWWVAQTKPQQEKRLAEDLAAAANHPDPDKRVDLAYYLPLVLRNTRKYGKRERTRVPLFPSYVFFAGGEFVRHAAVVTHRVAAVLPVVDQAKFVQQLRAVQVAIEHNPKLSLWPKTPVGSRGRVVRGPFLGAEGIVEAIRENAATIRLILRIDVLGASTAVELPSDYVEPA